MVCSVYKIYLTLNFLLLKSLKDFQSINLTPKMVFSTVFFRLSTYGFNRKSPLGFFQDQTKNCWIIALKWASFSHTYLSSRTYTSIESLPLLLLYLLWVFVCLGSRLYIIGLLTRCILMAIQSEFVQVSVSIWNSIFTEKNFATS